jgi:UDP-N-acetylmuramoyl-L-alanyl-D-glutamate--2,6-diaminopimelate ligase
VHELQHVGVTGTNGKTSTTRLVAAGLGAIARPVPSVTTIGAFLDEEPLATAMNRAGMLETLALGRERGARYAALEVTSEILALGFARAWPFRAAVFTNLTHDHLDQHESPEHYFASKAQLFHALPAEGAVAVVNGCDEVSELLLEVTPPGARRLAYGVPSRGEALLALAARAVHVEVTLAGTAADVELGPELGGGRVRLTTRAIGEIFLENALAACVTCLALGAEREALLLRLAAACPPSGRFEIVGRKPTVVVDYAHTPDALERTVATARTLTSGKVTIVFGAGGHRDPAKRPFMGGAVAQAERAVLTSDNPRDEAPELIALAIREGIPSGVEVVIELDRAQAIRRAILDAAVEDVVVVAGKGHETTQTVGSVARTFSDAEVARSVLAERARERS